MSTTAAPLDERRARADLAAALDIVVAMEHIVRSATAELYRCIERSRELAAVVDGVTADSGFREREFAIRSFVAELATTLTVPEATAGALIADAGRLTGPRRATLDALGAGDVSVAHVRSMLDVSLTLPPETADEVEATGLAVAPTLTSSAFRRRLHRLRERMHPESLATRRARSAADRRVVLEPAPDGMAWLSLFLEAERAVAIMSRIDALGEPGEGTASDARTRAQRACDIAADLLVAGALDGDDRTARAGAGVDARVIVTVPVLSLLGVTDEPAELDGYGPIDADTARRLAAHAPTLERLLVHPETGAHLSYGRSRYRAGADLAGYLRVRDGHCRFPGCARRASRCDLDHTTDWAKGGTTSLENLAHLCRKHHRLKHEAGWRVQQEPGGVIRWTSPAGHVLRTFPERPFVPVRAGAPPPSEVNAESVDSRQVDQTGDIPIEPPWMHASAA